MKYVELLIVLPKFVIIAKNQILIKQKMIRVVYIETALFNHGV